jgi:hypothetical protein
MSADTPAPPAPPPAPPWRPGTYADFLGRMLADGPVRTVPVPGGGTAVPLAPLNVRAPGDFGVALLGAWAVVGDVLCFYQERILDEGFLRTATEPRSIRELLRLTGYSPNPGVAASTALAFTVAAAPGASAGLVVPAGSAAQSVPGAGETPQVFETSADLLARPEWNALPARVKVRTVAQALSAGAASLRLAGTGAALRPGDPLLLDDAAGPAWSLALVQTAQADAKHGCTRVTLGEPAQGGVPGPLADPRAVAFRKRLSLFGHRAVPWAQAPDTARRAAMDPAGGVFRLDPADPAWRGANAGLPMAEVRAVLAPSTGPWLAAVAGAGVYASTDGGASWAPAGTGMPRAEVHALAEGPRGALYAGAAGGNVYRSRDGGASWNAVAARTLVRVDAPAPAPGTTPAPGVDPAPAPGKVLGAVSARLPATLVRSLLAWTESDGSVTLAAGTDSGVYTASDGTGAWAALNAVAGQEKGAGGLADTAVFALARDGSGTLLAGTTAGVFRQRKGASPEHGSEWTPANWNLPGTDPHSGFGTLAAAALVVGRDPGAGPAPPAGGAGPSAHSPAAGAPADLANRIRWIDSIRHADPSPTPSPTSPPPAPSPATPASTESTASTQSAGPADSTASTEPTASIEPTESAGSTVSKGSAETDAAAEAWWIATAEGVWRGDPVRKTWTKASEGLPAGPAGTRAARALAGGGDALAAGTAGGVFHSADGGRSWTETAPTPHVAPLPPARATGRGPAPPGLNNPDVRALSGTPGGVLLAATPFLGFIDPATGGPQAEWPRFGVSGRTVDLDGRQAAVVAGSRIALWQGTVDGGSQSALATVLEAEVTRRADFGLEGTVTRLTVSPDVPCGRFDPRAARVFAAPDDLPLDARTVPDPTPVAGTLIPVHAAGPALPPGQALVVTGARSRVALVPRAGVLRLGDGGPAPAGLAAQDVRVLAFGPAGALWAGTAAGVFVLPQPHGLSPTGWLDRFGGTAPRDVRALVFTPEGDALAATGGGAYRSAAAVAAWALEPGLPTAGVTALARMPDGTLWIAGPAGAFVRPAHGDGWRPGPPGLTATAVALAPGPGGTLYAGTDTGVFRLPPGAPAWKGFSPGLANTEVGTLAAGADGTVYAGTAGGGVFATRAGEDGWRPLARGSLGNADVRALAAAPDGGVYAGTYGGGAWHLAAAASAWRALPSGAASHVATLALEADGTPWAGCGAAPVLVSADGLATRELPLGPRAATLPLSAAGDLDGSAAPDGDRGGIAESLALALRARGVAVDVAACVEVRARGSAWTLVQPAGPAFLDLQPTGIEVRIPVSLPVLAAAPAPLARTGAVEGTAGGAALVACSVVLEDGFAGTLHARVDEAFPQPSAPGDAAVSERAAAAPVPGATDVVCLAAPLAGIYDPATVRVAGNVAAATQGATVPDEVLGSGGPGTGSPRFALKRPPLTYTPAPTPTGGAATLTVRVNGAAWTEVGALLPQPPDARVYQVLTGLDGAATVAFGDGVNGARPPTGHENVHAAYRTGTGASGNVEAGQVSVLRSRPAGVRAVTNPLPGSGGIDPEGAGNARTAGPVRLRALGRVVSVRDYADFALAFPGIARARADQLPGAGAPLVVTVAAAGGAAPDPGVLRELAASIAANRLNPVPFRVLPPDPLWFQLRARLAVAPAYERGAVASAAGAALREAYARDRRGFAQPVLLAEIITLVQRVEGVAALEPDALFVTGLAPRVHPRLEAAPARRDPDTGLPRGAQLLLPHPALGFTLTPVAP